MDQTCSISHPQLSFTDEKKYIFVCIFTSNCLLLFYLSGKSIIFYTFCTITLFYVGMVVLSSFLSCEARLNVPFQEYTSMLKSQERKECLASSLSNQIFKVNRKKRLYCYHKKALKKYKNFY